MIKKILVVVLMCFICSCAENQSKINYKCNSEQLDLVEKQLIICSKTGYLDSHCYDMARIEHCEVMKIDLTQG